MNEPQAPTATSRSRQNMSDTPSTDRMAILAAPHGFYAAVDLCRHFEKMARNAECNIQLLRDCIAALGGIEKLKDECPELYKRVNSFNPKVEGRREPTNNQMKG